MGWDLYCDGGGISNCHVGSMVDASDWIGCVVVFHDCGYLDFFVRCEAYIGPGGESLCMVASIDLLPRCE